MKDITFNYETKSEKLDEILSNSKSGLYYAKTNDTVTTSNNRYALHVSTYGSKPKFIKWLKSY